MRLNIGAPMTSARETMANRIGISGWRYEGRRGVFYPNGPQQARELEFASRVVDTIEINGSHYSLQTIGSYDSWYAATPAHFVFSVKGPRSNAHAPIPRRNRAARNRDFFRLWRPRA